MDRCTTTATGARVAQFLNPPIDRSYGWTGDVEPEDGRVRRLAVVPDLLSADLLRMPASGVLLAAAVAANLAGAHHGLNWGMSWRRLSSRPPLIDADVSAGGYLFHYQTTSLSSLDSAPTPVPGLEWWLSSIDAPDLAENARRLWRALYMNLSMIHGIGNASGSDAIDRSSDTLLRNVLAVLPREKALKVLRVFGVSALIGPEP